MKFQTTGTRVFERNFDAFKSDKRFIVNQGGTRSSKTYSIAQIFATELFKGKNILLTVVRKTLPSLKASAYKDFLDIIKASDCYNENNHNKSELTYKYKDAEIEFISVDQPQKIRGRKRQILWINEANELSYEDFRQLNLRTEQKIFLDYNPSDEYHWIYDNVMTRDDCIFIQSTYKDNPFLDKNIVQEIERLRATDENYWRIYGLGERGISETTIYKHWQLCDEIPPEDEKIYGLDFGYNNPSALLEVNFKDKEVYTKEKLYESFLTNQQLIQKMKDLEISETDYIYADTQEPQRIEEIKQAGFNIYPSDKDVGKGIDTVKSSIIYIIKDSVNLLKEIKNYKYKVKDEKVLDKPVKVNDHLMDCMRYALHTHLQRLEPNITIL